MTPEQLQSVYAKMAWARGHFHAVDAEIALWLKDESHRIVYERNEDFTQHYFRAEFGSKPRVDRWPLIVGDCVTNLRDTLDHLIYTIAHLPNSPMPAKAYKAAFIIRNTAADFAIDAKQRLCSVPDSVRDAVLSFQPFNRPHAVLPPLLSILAELANGSKHKLLNVVLTIPQNLSVNFISTRQRNGMPAVFALSKDGVVEGRPFLIFETPFPDPDCELKMARTDLGVAIAHTPLPGDVSFDSSHTVYRPLLQALFDEVENIISTISALI